MTSADVTVIPAPKRGGTFLYCPWPLHAWRARFRTAKTYRRHWRRYHADGAS